MGVLKIWHMNPDVVDSQGMLQHVQALLAQDSDPQVLGNCVTLLMQVQGVKRLSSNKVLLYTLINRIKVRGRQQLWAPTVRGTSKQHQQQRPASTQAVCVYVWCRGHIDGRQHDVAGIHHLSLQMHSACWSPPSLCPPPGVCPALMPACRS